VVNSGVFIGGSSSPRRVDESEEEVTVDVTQRQCGCNAITVTEDGNPGM